LIHICIVDIYLYKYRYVSVYHISVCGDCANSSDVGWLRLVGSIQLQVSFAKESYKRDDILQKRHIILSILLTVATPYCFPNRHMRVYMDMYTCVYTYVYIYTYVRKWEYTWTCTHVYTHTCMYTDIRTYVNMRMDTNTRMYVQIHVCTYIYVCIWI